MPDQKLIDAMGRYNEELIKAGALVSAEGLKASSHGARIHYSAGQRRVEQGPFPDPTTLVAGFWIIKVHSKEEAIHWAKRIPFEADLHGSGMPGGGNCEVELRPIYELEDFPPSPAIESERAFRDRNTSQA